MTTQSEAVKKWRKAHPEKRTEQRRRYYDNTPNAGNSSKEPWTREQDRAITEPNKPTDRELAVRLGRSVRAIQVRRTRIDAEKLWGAST